MNKLDAFFLKLFLYGVPVLIGYAGFAYSYDPDTSTQAEYIKALYNLGGIVFGVWMTLSIYLSIRLMISELFREKVLAKLTFIKERDEREILLTGKAAKTTMLTSLAILIFLFCLSCFQVSIYSVPPEQSVEGKSRAISLGLNFSIFESTHQENQEEVIYRKNIISYTGLPVSNSTVILGLIIWQIAAYNYSMRRLMK